MAKRFTFRLETLLRVRELHEREAKRRVGAKQAEIAQIDELNRLTGVEISQRQEALRAQQEHDAIDPQSLTRSRAWIAYLRRTIATRDRQRAEMVIQLDQLQAVLREARREKRIIENLRERRKEEHRKRENRREQAGAEELAQQLHGFDHLATGKVRS